MISINNLSTVIALHIYFYPIEPCRACAGTWRAVQRAAELVTFIYVYHKYHIHTRAL